MRSRSPAPCAASSHESSANMAMHPMETHSPGETQRSNPKNRLATSQGQVVLLSLVCFCCPGMYNAVLSMGGGVEDQSVLADSIVALHICFVVSSMASPALCTSLGPRVTLFLGTLGYTAYIASLACYQHLGIGGGAVVAGGALNGISAGMLWTAQGQLIMSYPSQDSKGRFLSLFWGIFNLGAVFGGILTAVANWHVEAAAASLATYVGFMALMAVGSVLSLLLASPATVQRPDGTFVQEVKTDDTGDPVPLSPSSPGLQRVRSEVRALVKTVALPLVSWLLPMALYSNWFYTYQFSCFNHELFTVRSQGVNNSVYWCAQMYGAWALGRFLDKGTLKADRAQDGVDPAVDVRRRAARSLVATSGLVVGTWVASLLVTVGGRDATAAALDIVESGWSYAPLLALYMMWGVADSLVMVWLLWVLGQDSNDLPTLARYSGIVKAVQASGSVLSWKLNTAEAGMGCRGQLWINFLLAIAGLCTACRAVRHLCDEPGNQRRGPPADGLEDPEQVEQQTLL